VLVLDDEGNVYGTFNPYRIFKYDPAADRLSDLPVIIPHREGPWCDKGHYHRETVWRDVTWHPEEKAIYGIEMGSSTLFRFDPRTNDIEDLGQLVLPWLVGERIVPETSHSLIWHEGLERIIYSAPHPDQHTDPKPRHLLTYDPKTGEKVDHGPMLDPETGAFPYYTEGVTVANDGTIYFGGNVKLPGVAAGPYRRTCGLVILKPSQLSK
jgi:hypothetical protein